MNNDKTVLILGAGVYQVPLIRAAKKRDMRTIVASIPGKYPGFALADKVCLVNTTDKEKILSLAREEAVDAVTTTGTDVAVLSVGYVCEKLGLPGLSEQTAKVLTDKALMKEAFVRGQVVTAPFQRVSSCQEAEKAADRIGYPVILKIVDKSGSRGITKTENRKEIRPAWEYAEAATNASYMIIEKFVEGTEIGIDALIQNGIIKLIIPHAKYVYHSERTGIPAGHYCPMNCSPVLYHNIIKETEKIIKATGMDNCAVNIDAFVLPDDRVSIIEAAGRCGATGIPEVIGGYTGRDYYDCILDNALGIPIDDFNVTAGTPTASMLILSEYSGKLRRVRFQIAGRCYDNENCSVPGAGLIELDVKPGDPVSAFENGTDRIGMAVFQGKTMEELWERIASFRNSLHVDVQSNQCDAG